jgi:DNA-binding NarL/FixJ family response regulator
MTTPCRVAVCEDDREFRQLMAMTLEYASDVVVIGEAENGQQAVDLATSARPDVLLLDLTMPVMDGFESLRLIRTASPESKVIIVSSSPAGEARDRTLNSGAVAYIQKGRSVAAIVEAVRAACSDG